MKEILNNIKAIRESKGYSQDQIADLLKISQSQYARFERGITKTDLQTLYKFAKALEVELIDIITYPKKYIDIDMRPSERIEATLQIKLRHDTRDQVLKLVFGENNLEILNK